ncbi:MAG: CooT family nickel-binding protein [Candidatus Adiutrix intracellularis]|jgi:predicted RNA-binding protein|nr:CooT family nickel-binding protein [Candidatus Adiutrix intracellularis]
MCEANVYLTARDSQIETLFLEAVDQIIPEGLEIWRLISIFGEQKILAGHIKSMNLVNHRIIFESPGA